MTVVAEVQDGQEGQPSEFLWHGSAQLEIPERESAIEVREFPEGGRNRTSKTIVRKYKITVVRFIIVESEIR